MNKTEQYHLAFFPKLASWFSVFYFIAPFTQIKADPSGFQLWSFPLVAAVALLSVLFYKWATTHGKEDLGQTVIKWVVLGVTFFVPIHILLLLVFTRGSGSEGDLHHHVYAYYISISVCSVVLYSNKQTALFYVKNVLVSLLIPFGLTGHPFYEFPVSSWILHPALVFGIGGIQLVILNLFKIRIVRAFEEEKTRAERAEARNMDILEKFEGLASRGFDGVVVFNPRLEVTYLNDRALSNEYARNQVLGRRVGFLCERWELSEGDSLVILKGLTKALTSKKTVFTPLTRPEGRMLLFFTPTHENGEVSEIVMNVRVTP